MKVKVSKIFKTFFTFKVINPLAPPVILFYALHLYIMFGLLFATCLGGVLMQIHKHNNHSAFIFASAGLIVGFSFCKLEKYIIIRQENDKLLIDKQNLSTSAASTGHLNIK